jgi:hypothetical protein
VSRRVNLRELAVFALALTVLLTVFLVGAAVPGLEGLVVVLLVSAWISLSEELLASLSLSYAEEESSESSFIAAVRIAFFILARVALFRDFSRFLKFTIVESKDIVFIFNYINYI